MTDNAPAAAATEGDKPGGSEYGEFFKELVAGQEARKTSVEQRGITVITTSGALVTLLFGLVAVITKAEGFTLPKASHGPLGIGLMLFVVAAVLGLLTNVPLPYTNVTPESVETALDRWNEPPEKAQVRVAATRLKVFKRAQKVNEWKARVLIAAMLAEVAAVCAVAVAVDEVLGAA